MIRRFRAYPASRDWYFSPGLFLAALRAKYDLVHVQGVHTLVPPMAMVAALLRRRPYLLTFHTGGNSSSFREKARGTQWRILAPLLRRADRLVGVSVFEGHRFDDVLGWAPGTITVIRNGGSLPAGDPENPVARVPGRIVSVGRVERYKGHHKAIEALPHLIRTHPEAHVQVLGSGPYEPDLLALAESLGVRDRVTVEFIPPVDRALMGERMAAAGVMTLLSDYEAHPVAVMEALTAGTPAVVSRTSGLTELGGHWAGRSVSTRTRPPRRPRRRSPGSSTTRCCRSRRSCPHGRRVLLVWRILTTRSSRKYRRPADRRSEGVGHAEGAARAGGAPRGVLRCFRVAPGASRTGSPGAPRRSRSWSPWSGSSSRSSATAADGPATGRSP